MSFIPLHRKGFACVVLLLAVFASSTRAAETIIRFGSTWKYLKGTAEASNPTSAWRATAFDDSTWLTGAAPFHYGENAFAGTGTTLSDMRNNYRSFFLRKTFTVA